MLRMILTDLDHTLLRQDGSLSPTTLQVLQACRAKGMLLAIATARYWIGAERYLDQLQPDYAITTDGTLLHAGDRCLFSAAFTREETDRLVEGIQQAAPGTEITLAREKAVYWNSHNIAASEKLHKAMYWDGVTSLGVGANKLVALLPDPPAAEKIAKLVPCRLQRYRGEDWVGFLPAGAGKVAAIRVLAQASGVPLEAIVAFGDDANDLEMLRLCGTGVAVANALPEVLAAADETAPSNEEDGVARWLAAHCLAP